MTTPALPAQSCEPKCSHRVRGRSMVPTHMGLLDDAIREHLELKRRRGADPTEVARQQEAALDSVPDEGLAPELSAAEQASGTPNEPESPLPPHDQQLRLADNARIAPAEASVESGDMAATAASAAHELEDALAPAAPESATGQAEVGQETVELDMKREFEQDEQAAPGDH
jgi:hypothetical protein